MIGNYVPHPTDGKLLREIDACRMELSKALHMWNRDISMLDKCACQLKEENAEPVSMHNIRNSSLMAVQYLRLAQMSLENMSADMRKLITPTDYVRIGV